MVEDPQLGDGARIRYEGDGSGGMRSVVLEIGPEVTEGDLAAHLDALVLMQRLETLDNRLGRLLEGGDSPPAGTAGFEARAELRKLREMVKARRAVLTDAPLSPDTRQLVQGEIDVMEANAEHFAARVDEVGVGTGEVARPDAPPGYPPLPRGPDGEQLYAYFKNSDGEWDVRRWPGSDAPSLQLEAKADGSGFELVEAPHRAEPRARFPEGTTRQSAFEQLTSDHSRSTFKEYYALLEREGLATRAEVIAAMADPSGATEESIRHGLKEHFRERLLVAMTEGPDGSLSAEDSVAAMRRMLDDLNPSDRGNLAEAWYQRFARLHGDRPDLVAHPDLPASATSSGTARRPDFVEGHTIVEVKSSRSGLSARDVEQLTDFLEVARDEGGHVLVGGEPRMVREVRLVFTEVEGARGALGDLERYFQDYEEELLVEVFTDRGPQTFTTFQALTEALSS
ncbi:MAG: hypothetical protein D6798_19830 [Deltaproteobacteria bacterium]|nr:MAG: hypothetical protein D6798_19830 [Deltaproteobacteria bacterium]